MIDDVRVVCDPEHVADTAARIIADVIVATRTAGNAVHIALAGGSTPAATYERLALTPLDWSSVHLWLGDERLVAPDADDANVLLVRSHLIDRIDGERPRLHAVPTDRSVEDAAASYGAAIADALPTTGAGVPCFDLVMLGLGEDGHVASLFPASLGLTSTATCIAVRDAPKPPPQRISLTLHVINAARRRLIVTTGAAKADAVARAVGSPQVSTPASLLRHSMTTLVCDRAARGEG